MDAHIHLVVVGIDDADNLLILLCPGVATDDGHAHQSGKLSDSQVHMDEEIARFQFLQLLHRECHLAVSGGIGAQTVFMVAVENLMIGEKTQFQGIVGKSLVERMVNGRERNGHLTVISVTVLFLSDFLEDVAQTFLLLLTVGQHIEFVALLQIVLKGRNKQFKILVEERLRRDFAVHHGIGLLFR